MGTCRELDKYLAFGHIAVIREAQNSRLKEVVKEFKNYCENEADKLKPYLQRKRTYEKLRVQILATQ